MGMGLRTLSVLFLALCAFSFRFKSAKAFLFKINTLQQSSISPRSRCPICSSPLRVHRVESGWEPGDGSDSSKVYAEYDQYVKMYDETTREKVVATRPADICRTIASGRKLLVGIVIKYFMVPLMLTFLCKRLTARYSTFVGVNRFYLDRINRALHGLFVTLPCAIALQHRTSPAAAAPTAPPPPPTLLLNPTTPSSAVVEEELNLRRVPPALLFMTSLPQTLYHVVTLAPSPLMTTLSYLTSLTVYFQYMPVYYRFTTSCRNFIKRLASIIFYFLLPLTLAYGGLLGSRSGCVGGVAAKIIGGMGVINLLGFLRLVRVEIAHDVPLIDVEEVGERVLEERTRVRVRLRWRNPRPFKDQVEYLLFDSLTTPLIKRDPSLVFRRRKKVLDPKQSSNKLLRKEYEHGVETRKTRRGPGPDSPMSDRASWVEEAARFRAGKHEDDMESGDIKDPLGLAVQQTLNVGASFSFDYNDIDDLESADQVVHVLRARCALSAVKRARWLFDPERAKAVIELVEGSEADRNAAKAKLVKEAEAELEVLARMVESMSVLGLDAPKGCAIDFMEVRQQDLTAYQPAPSSMDDVISDIVKDEFGIGEGEGDDDGEDWEDGEDDVVLSSSQKNVAILKALREREEKAEGGVVTDVQEQDDAEFVKSWVDQKLGLNEDGTRRDNDDGDGDGDVGIYVA
ncbi:hypothetical protein TrST_g10675 [Triparma strigata]|uniref:Uncharacterized protein n=1 Tax=Triparma strigata TaxID=1606541 RepID=A0A9W7F107_9STRA|nr:hypothetical protein TrST_g10675 [Triparma strigata]